CRSSGRIDHFEPARPFTASTRTTSGVTGHRLKSHAVGATSPRAGPVALGVVQQGLNGPIIGAVNGKGSRLGSVLSALARNSNIWYNELKCSGLSGHASSPSKHTHGTPVPLRARGPHHDRVRHRPPPPPRMTTLLSIGLAVSYPFVVIR